MQRFCLTLLLILACATAVPAASLYDQPPFNEKELQRFIADFPDFRAWCKAQRIQPRPLVDASGKADLAYTRRQARIWRARAGSRNAFCAFSGAWPQASP